MNQTSRASRHERGETSAEPEELLTPGDVILHGKYRVEHLLGKGAFAQVYLVRHVELGVDRAFEAEEEALYLAMEYAPSGSLTDLLEAEGRLCWRASCSMFVK